MNDENKELDFEIVEEDSAESFAEDCGEYSCEGGCGEEGCEGCSGSCGSCGGCSNPEDFIAKPHPMSNVRRVIGVISGKGGVGKSLVTSLSAVMMRRKGYKVGVLDADLTGPSIPACFGVHERAQANEYGILTNKTSTGIDIMSVNLFLDSETDPVVWRGSIIANTVKQFWTDVIWEDVDYMFVDMPPGTGDVPLTVFQSLPVDGIIVVTSPQELVGMIVSKAVKMAKMMNVPIIGLVENFSWFECDECGKKHSIFGESRLDAAAAEFELPILARLPVRPLITQSVDAGKVEEVQFPEIQAVADAVESMLPVEKAE